MKYVSMRIPEFGPFGKTFLEASDLAIVAALLVNNPPADAWNQFLLLLPTGFFLSSRVSSLAAFEILNGTLVSLCCFSGAECAEVAPPTRLGILLA
jgi:hypothetical protein